MDDKVVALLEELVVWNRFLARDPLERSLRAVLREPKHQVVYELTDGVRTQAEIASIVRVDQTTVSDLWARWRRAGIVREDGRRPRHLIRLGDLGWEVELPAAARLSPKRK